MERNLQHSAGRGEGLMRAETASCPVGMPPVADDPMYPEHVQLTRSIYRSVQRRCGVAIGAANLIGGILVFVLGVFVVPDPYVAHEDELIRLNVIMFVVLGVVGGVLGTTMSL